MYEIDRRGGSPLLFTMVSSDGRISVTLPYPAQQTQWSVSVNVNRVPLLGKGTHLSVKGLSEPKLSLSEVVLYRGGGSVVDLQEKILDCKGKVFSLSLGERIVSGWLLERVNIQERSHHNGYPYLSDLGMEFSQTVDLKAPRIRSGVALTEAQKKSALEQMTKLKIVKPTVTDDGTLLSRNVVVGSLVNGKVVLAG